MKPQRSHTVLSAAWAALTLCLVSACSMAAGESPVPPAASTQAAAPPAAADPNVARLAREFESRVTGLVLRIARDKRLSRKTVEAELGVKLSVDPAESNRLPQWRLEGEFSPEHRFLIKLKTRETDLQLLIFNPAFGASGCYLATAPIRSALVKSQFSAEDMGAGKRPFTLLRSTTVPSPNSVSVRLFDEARSATRGEQPLCVYRLDIAAPSA